MYRKMAREKKELSFLFRGHNEEVSEQPQAF